MKLPNIWLIICSLIFVGTILFGFLVKRDNLVRRLYHLAANNIVVTLGLIVLLVVIYFWAANRKVFTEKALLDAKVYKVIAIAGFAFFLFYRAPFDITQMKVGVIKAAIQQKSDSIVAVSKEENNRLLRIVKKERYDLKKKSSVWRQSFDSLLAVSNAKDQQIKSIKGMNKDLAVTNHTLDSLNSIKKETTVIIKEIDHPASTPNTAKVAPPVVKTDEKKTVSNVKKVPRKPTRQHIVWERPKQKVTYKSPKICFN